MWRRKRESRRKWRNVRSSSYEFRKRLSNNTQTTPGTPEEKEARLRILKKAANELALCDAEDPSSSTSSENENEKTKRKRWAKEEKQIRAKLEELKIQQEEAKKRKEEKKKSILKAKYAEREKQLQEDNRKPVDSETVDLVRDHVLSFLFHKNMFFCV